MKASRTFGGFGVRAGLIVGALLPFVLMRSAAVTFLSRGDTTTPVIALFVAVAVNVTLKILLMDGYAQVGLAFATSVGAWTNLAILVWLAARRNLLVIDQRLRRSSGKLVVAAGALAIALFVCQRPVADLFAHGATLRDEATLLVLGVIGVLVYGGVVLLLFGRQWLEMLRSAPESMASPPRDDGTA